MKLLRLLAILVVVAFLLLLLVGFDNVLGLLRSRVAIFLALVPLLGIFLWSVYQAVRARRESQTFIKMPSKKR